VRGDRAALPDGLELLRWLYLRRHRDILLCSAKCSIGAEWASGCCGGETTTAARARINGNLHRASHDRPKTSVDTNA
jgi:hypothetical protein